MRDIADLDDHKILIIKCCKNYVLWQGPKKTVLLPHRTIIVAIVSLISWT